MINIVQTWLIISFRFLKKGGLIIGALELVEFPLIIWLILKAKILGFLVVVLTNIVQWLIIGIITLRE